MRLIVGLGNPGVEYVRTRHNAGFMALDAFVAKAHIDGPKHKFHGEFYDGFVYGKRCLVLKPLTYMNRSGLAVGEVCAFHKIAPKDVLVVVDDLALPCGQIRLRASGSAGGHNGLADVQRVLGTQDYPRLRIGIDPKGRIPQADYVLSAFTQEQLPKMDEAWFATIKAIEAWLSVDIDKAMTQVNGALGKS